MNIRTAVVLVAALFLCGACAAPHPPELVSPTNVGVSTSLSPSAVVQIPPKSSVGIETSQDSAIWMTKKVDEFGLNEQLTKKMLDRGYHPEESGRYTLRIRITSFDMDEPKEETKSSFKDPTAGAPLLSAVVGIVQVPGIMSRAYADAPRTIRLTAEVAVDDSLTGNSSKTEFQGTAIVSFVAREAYTYRYIEEGRKALRDALVQAITTAYF